MDQQARMAHAILKDPQSIIKRQQEQRAQASEVEKHIKKVAMKVSTFK